MMNFVEYKIKRNNSKKTCIGVGCCGGLIVAAALGTVAAVYGGAGWLGWSAVKSHVIYDEVAHDARQLADKNRDGNLDTLETKLFFDEMGLKMSEGKDAYQMRPAFQKLEEYVDRH